MAILSLGSGASARAMKGSSAAGSSGISRLGGIKYSLGEQFGDITKVDKDVKSGGNQIEYCDEDPSIRKMFEEELAKSGTYSRMNPDLYKKKK